MPLPNMDTRLANLFSTRPIQNPSVVQIFPSLTESEKKSLSRLFGMASSGQPPTGRKAIYTIDRTLREWSSVSQEDIAEERWPNVEKIWNADVNALRDLQTDLWRSCSSSEPEHDGVLPRASFLRFRVLNTYREPLRRAMNERRQDICTQIVSDAYLGDPPDLLLRIVEEICADPTNTKVRRTGFLIGLFAIVDLIAAVDTDLMSIDARSLFKFIVMAADPISAWKKLSKKPLPPCHRLGLPIACTQNLSRDSSSMNNAKSK